MACITYYMRQRNVFDDNKVWLMYVLRSCKGAMISNNVFYNGIMSDPMEKFSILFEKNGTTSKSLLLFSYIHWNVKYFVFDPSLENQCEYEITKFYHFITTGSTWIHIYYNKYDYDYQ